MILFHLLFELAKICVLACVYASLFLLILRLAASIKPKGWWDIISVNKIRFWFRSGFLMSVALFLFMFTYYGDHGLGDNARIPIGHMRAVHQADSYYTYLQNSEGGQLRIVKFKVENNNLYAETQQNFKTEDNNAETQYKFNADEKEFVIWNLQTDKWKSYKTKKEFINSANNIPDPDSYKFFSEIYSQYWYGWRFWLLP
jgi:hypothetical protein